MNQKITKYSRTHYLVSWMPSIYHLTKSGAVIKPFQNEKKKKKRCYPPWKNQQNGDGTGLRLCFEHYIKSAFAIFKTFFKFAKIRINVCILSQNCDWIFSLISSPVLNDKLNFYLTHIKYCYQKDLNTKSWLSYRQ